MKYRKAVARTLQSASTAYGMRRISPNRGADMGMTIAVQAVWGVVASNCVTRTRHRQTNVSRTKGPAGSPSAALLAALLMAAVPAAHGQNATPAAGQSANPSSSAPTSGGANKGAQAGAAGAQA